MKANELRVNNIIEGGEVTSIYWDYKIGYYIEVMDHTRGTMSVREDELKPIPLTEEWLVKLGYYRSSFIDFQFEIKGSDYRICEYDGKFIFRGLGASIVEVKTVHHLQNLYFALTGEEITIQG